MPFDVLPSHHIEVPRVQFPNIPWAAYAQMQIEAARERYGALLKGMDSILQAADPVNIAQRRQALNEMQFEQKYGFPLKEAQAQYTMQTLPMRLEFFKKYGYEMPTTPGGMKTMRELQNEDEQARRHAGFSGDGGEGGGIKPGTDYTQGQYERAISPEAHDIASGLLNPSDQPALPTPAVPQIFPQTGEAEDRTTATPGTESATAMTDQGDQGEEGSYA